jgi:cytidylate kinase
MYRTVALIALQTGIDLDDEAALGELAESLALVMGGRVVANGVDVTEAIRSPEVNAAVSVVASIRRVRAAMVERQRAWTTAHDGAVLEGRDIGSVVLPDADVKVFLTASEQVRARRRASEEGATSAAEQLATRASIAKRDAIDSTRAASPLSVADGAVVIDSTNHSAADVIAMVVDLATTATLRRAEG